MLFDWAEVSLAVINGKITVSDVSTTHDAFHTLVLSADGQETGVSVTALEGNTDFILVRNPFALIRGISCAHARHFRSRENRSIRRSYSTVRS
jgi:hypothetical protein